MEKYNFDVRNYDRKTIEFIEDKDLKTNKYVIEVILRFIWKLHLSPRKI